jgi:hypothetical protein
MWCSRTMHVLGIWPALASAPMLLLRPLKTRTRWLQRLRVGACSNYSTLQGGAFVESIVTAHSLA